MNVKINPAETPEDAYKPDPQNNPIHCEEMLYSLLMRAKAHLLLCSCDNVVEEKLAYVPEKYIVQAIFSVIGMLEQAEKTMDYMYGQCHSLAVNEVLIKLQLSHAGITQVSRKTVLKAAEKLLQGNTREIVKDDHGEERIFHINSFSILREG